MNGDEHLAVEVAQFVQHVHAIADLLAERMGRLPEAEGEVLLEHLAVRAKQLEATIGMAEIASSVGYKVSVVIRTRVAELLTQR